MNKTFIQIRNFMQVKRKLLAIKKLFEYKCVKEHILESWFEHSSCKAVGYEFDFPHNY